LYWDREDKLSVDFSGKFPMLRIRAESEKGKKDRLIPMVPEFANLLQSVSEEKRVGRVFNPLPLKRRGGGLLPTTISKKIADIGEKANVVVSEDGNKDKETGKIKPRYASAHDLRRSFGERWSLKVMPQVLMQLMRHESMETTLKYYVGRNAEKAAEVIWGVADSGDTFGDTSKNHASAVV
jgi:integrase